MPLFIRSYLPSDRQAVWNLHVSALEAVGARVQHPTYRHDADLDDIENVYLNGGGEFLAGLLDERIVAIGALKRLSGSVAGTAKRYCTAWRPGRAILAIPNCGSIHYRSRRPRRSFTKKTVLKNFAVCLFSATKR